MQFAADGVPRRKEGRKGKESVVEGGREQPHFSTRCQHSGGDTDRANDLLYHGLYHRREKGKEIKREIHRKEMV